MKYLITGGTGFVGGAVARKLLDGRNIDVAVVVRKQSRVLPDEIQQIVVDSLLIDSDYSEALQGVDVVIHAAARVHVMDDDASDPLVEFFKVNVEGTLNLARQAAEKGVKRFVFVSSIGVNGNGNDRSFVETDPPNPKEPYAISKYEAEQQLIGLTVETGLEVVIIRPPLVYGPYAPGNFGSLIRWVSKEFPLPFGAVYNKRSLVALDNLVSFIIVCAEHPKAGNETFLISDGEDVSTTELLQKVARSLSKKSCLIPVPVGLMRFVALFLGRRNVANRLFSSLRVDSSKARELLDWEPVVSMSEQLKKIVKSLK